MSDWIIARVINSRMQSTDGYPALAGDSLKNLLRFSFALFGFALLVAGSDERDVGSSGLRVVRHRQVGRSGARRRRSKCHRHDAFMVGCERRTVVDLPEVAHVGACDAHV